MSRSQSPADRLDASANRTLTGRGSEHRGIYCSLRRLTPAPGFLEDIRALASFRSVISLSVNIARASRQCRGRVSGGANFRL